MVFPKDGNRLEFAPMCYRLMPSGRILERAGERFNVCDDSVARSQLLSTALRSTFLISAAVGGISVIAPHIFDGAEFLSKPEVQRSVTLIVLGTMLAVFSFRHLFTPDIGVNEITL